MSTIKPDLSPELLNELTARFEFHGKNIYGSPSSENNSTLYAHLAVAASTDPEILRLVAEADLETQITNLLFAAVQFLLLGGVQHPLAAYYPNLTDTPLPIEDSYPHFRAFCLEHTTEIQELVTTRRVQTNEVGRCAGLVPAFNLVANRGEGKPLALVEIGTSAGLHLLWDYCGYDYGDAGYVGSDSSPVQIKSVVKGTYQPPIPANFPPINARLGLDLNPIDVHDEGATRWLQALVWPEHRDRQALLRAALHLAQQHPLNILAGNAADILPDMLATVPDNATLCVFHSYVFTQMPQRIREQTLAHLLAHSRQRDLFRLSQEWMDGWDQPRIELFSYHQGEVQSELLAYSESHGRWIEWLQH